MTMMMALLTNSEWKPFYPLSRLNIAGGAMTVWLPIPAGFVHF